MTTWTSIAGPELIEAVGWCLVHSVWQAAAVAPVRSHSCSEPWIDRTAQARYVVACAVPGDDGTLACFDVRVLRGGEERG